MSHYPTSALASTMAHSWHNNHLSVKMQSQSEKQQTTVAESSFSVQRWIYFSGKNECNTVTIAENNEWGEKKMHDW